MSDEEGTSETIKAKFKGGQLQIVEVAQYEREEDQEEETSEQILPDIDDPENGNGMKQYVEVLDQSGKGLVQLDLLNLTFVRCSDGSDNEYQLVATEDVTEGEEGTGDETTMTCVLESSEGQSGSYVMVDGEDGYMFLESNTEEDKHELEVNEPSSSKGGTGESEKIDVPQLLLEKVKLIQKQRDLKKAMKTPPKRAPSPKRRGRKRVTELPSPHEMLSSPSFKLYLYSCKFCSFKCNAIKELTAHKSSEHSAGSARWRAGAGSRAVNLQCARCPYRAATQPQLMKHVRENHLMEVIFDADKKEKEKAPYKIRKQAVPTNSLVDQGIDLLICGGCGFESRSEALFEEHIKTHHSAEV